MRYNDISPLENHHCAVAFQILARPECAIFANVQPEGFKQIRQVRGAVGRWGAVRQVNAAVRCVRQSDRCVGLSDRCGGHRCGEGQIGQVCGAVRQVCGERACWTRSEAVGAAVCTATRDPPLQWPRRPETPGHVAACQGGWRTGLLPPSCKAR